MVTPLSELSIECTLYFELEAKTIGVVGLPWNPIILDSQIKEQDDKGYHRILVMFFI